MIENVITNQNSYLDGDLGMGTWDIVDAVASKKERPPMTFNWKELFPRDAIATKNPSFNKNLFSDNTSSTIQNYVNYEKGLLSIECWIMLEQCGPEWELHKSGKYIYVLDICFK